MPAARRNLLEHPVRLLASVAGVTFAVVLMFLQNGFRNALLENMVAIARHLDGEVLITHRGRYILSQPVTFPLERLETCRGVPGVLSVHPFYLEVSPATRWRDPESGLKRPIRVLAYRPEDRLLDLAGVAEQSEAWSQPLAALVDRQSKPSVFGSIGAGVESELAGTRIRIVGSFSLGSDFRSNGTLLMSERTLLEVVPMRDMGSLGQRQIDLGVLRLDRDAEPELVRQILTARLPADVIALTREQLIQKEQHFWRRVTPIGVVFDIGVIMGFIVGAAICYQVLSAEILDRLPQFATLKAMGYGQGDLLAIVMRQGVMLGVAGFALGWLISLGLYRWLERLTHMNLILKPLDAGLIFALTMLMCVAAALLAARRLSTVDPAELFA